MTNQQKTNSFVYNRQEETEDLPVDPEEWFTFNEVQLIDRVIHQFNIENKCNPICLSDFANLHFIIEKYPHIKNYCGIPVRPGIDNASMGSVSQQATEWILKDRSAGYEARVKKIEDKLPMSLCSPLVLAHVAKVLKHGNIKYGSHMWRDDPQPFSQELDSINRHWLALAAGQDIDPDSGEPHLALIICRSMFLLERLYTYPELDDRHHLEGLALEQLNRLLYPNLFLHENSEPSTEVDKCCGNC